MKEGKKDRRRKSETKPCYEQTKRNKFDRMLKKGKVKGKIMELTE